MRLTTGAASEQHAEPLRPREFAALMRSLGPFEPRMHLAVAVSGGRDSMALILLAAGWAAARGGRATAVTVDHGLRPDSAGEARQVGRWLRSRGVRHVSLRWQGPHPRSDVQAAARRARYELLECWCAESGVLHLLLAHHREDQAETFLLRLGRGSGLDGLAGMAAVTEHRQVRVLRPLLSVPRARLEATLAAAKQPWIDDPSNVDGAQARARLRAALPALGGEGLTVERLAGTAFRLGRARAALDRYTDGLLAAAVMVHPAGYLHLDCTILATAPAEIALSALARCISTVAGRDYRPRLQRLENLYREIVDGGPGRTRTLAGCLVAPWKGQALICREPASVAPPLRLTPGLRALWDGRFAVLVEPALRHRVALRALGREGLQIVKADNFSLDTCPRPARTTLPSLWSGERLVAVPHLGYRRPGRSGMSKGVVHLAFRPRRSLTGAQFGIV
ncbi:MAG: tRNA lysidine(34) synthetase TilS [Alphaproteobacteria bacterium]